MWHSHKDIRLWICIDLRVAIGTHTQKLVIYLFTLLNSTNKNQPNVSLWSHMESKHVN